MEINLFKFFQYLVLLVMCFNALFYMMAVLNCFGEIKIIWGVFFFILLLFFKKYKKPIMNFHKLPKTNHTNNWLQMMFRYHLLNFELIWILTVLHNTFITGIVFAALAYGTYFIFQQAANLGGAAPLELKSLEELRITMLTVLELSITNFWESLPVGHTWEELAQEMHKGTESRELLILLINELMTVRLTNQIRSSDMLF